MIFSFLIIIYLLILIFFNFHIDNFHMSVLVNLLAILMTRVINCFLLFIQLQIYFIVLIISLHLKII